MGEIYLFGLLVVVNFICVVVAIKQHSYGIIFSIFCTLICLASVISLYCERSTLVKQYDILVEYEKVIRNVEIYKTSSDERLKSLYLPNLEKDVDEINKTIMENRNYDSWWDGYRYSKSIGELKLISL